MAATKSKLINLKTQLIFKVLHPKVQNIVDLVIECVGALELRNLDLFKKGKALAELRFLDHRWPMFVSAKKQGAAGEEEIMFGLEALLHLKDKLSEKRAGGEPGQPADYDIFKRLSSF